MYDLTGGFKSLRRQGSRRRSERALRRLAKDVRNNMLATRALALAAVLSSGMPGMRPRHRRLRTVVMSAPVVIVLGMGGLAAMLLWDDRRRAAMRRRLDHVAGTVTHNRNRPAEVPPVPTVS
jgi:hypothetical protein